MAFQLARNAKSADFLEGNCKIAWDMLVSKYAPCMVSSFLKLKIKFHNSKLDLIKKDPDEWIFNLGELRIHMGKLDQKGSITDKDFMIHILNNFPKEYDAIFDWLENHLTVSGDSVLTIETIVKNFTTSTKKIKTKMIPC